MRTVSRAVACQRRVLERGALRTSCARFFSAAVPWNGGLLGPTSSDQHYAKELDLKMAAELLTTRGVLWKAAEADVGSSGRGESVDKYLARVKSAAVDFKRREELHDREAIMGIFREMLRGEGQLALALGGKSVGKSFILLKLAEELQAERGEKGTLEATASHSEQVAAIAIEQGHDDLVVTDASDLVRGAATGMRPRRVVIYDARNDGSDMVMGLLKAFAGQPKFWVRYQGLLSRGAGLAAGAAAAVTLGPTAGRTAATITADAVQKQIETFAATKGLSDVVESFIKSCEEEGCFPCLVVDEANKAFVASTEAIRERTVAALDLLTRYSKQSNRMNVIFASSEYTEPYRLSKLGVKSDHFTDTVLVPEVAPKEMRQLLEDKWGMGPNLASAFMSVWGGHIHAAIKGIERLAAAKESFAAIDNLIAFSPNAKRGATFCVEAEKVRKLQGTENMIQMLCRLAERGFVPFKSEDDERVRIMVERDVGGVVIRGSIAPGISPEHWSTAKSNSAAVATNHAMRMLLANELVQAGADGSPPREA